MMRRGKNSKQRNDLRLVLDGDVFREETHRGEFELQHPMPSPGTVSKRLKRNQQHCKLWTSLDIFFRSDKSISMQRAIRTPGHDR